MFVVRSTFTSGVCSNGAALSSIGVSWSVFDSVFTRNRAIGRGANPAQGGTPGGGSGGAIYTDGNDFRVLLAGTRMHRNHAREGGGAVFFVSNDRTGIAGDPLLHAAPQPERRLRDRPGHLLPRPEADGRRLRRRVS